MNKLVCYMTLTSLLAVNLVVGNKIPQCDPSTCARGRSGKRGPKGEPGTCEACDEKPVTEQLEKELQELKVTVEKLVKRIETLETNQNDVKPTETSKFPDGLCRVIYSGKCFWMIYDGYGVNHDKAAELCKKNHGGALANIYDETHYNKIVDSVRSRLPSFLNFHTLWLGMKYDPATKSIFFTDGKKSAFQRWYPGTPFPINTDMIVWIARNPNERNQGMWNYGRNTIHHGSLCEL